MNYDAFRRQWEAALREAGMRSSAAWHPNRLHERVAQGCTSGGPRRRAAERPDRASACDFHHRPPPTELAQTSDLVSTGYPIGHKHATTTERYIHRRKQMAEHALQKLASVGAAPLLPANDGGSQRPLVQFVASSDADVAGSSPEPRHFASGLS